LGRKRIGALNIPDKNTTKSPAKGAGQGAISKTRADREEPNVQAKEMFI
jgi:hypothetical protein